MDLLKMTQTFLIGAMAVLIGLIAVLLLIYVAKPYLGYIWEFIKAVFGVFVTCANWIGGHVKAAFHDVVTGPPAGSISPGNDTNGTVILPEGNITAAEYTGIESHMAKIIKS